MQGDRLFSTMHIEASGPDDLGAIMRLYADASALQRSKGMVMWPEFPPSLVEKELEAGLQWKGLVDGEIACVWAVAFQDPLIWGERDADPSVYLHRIATDPTHRGQGLVGRIVTWAEHLCRERGLCFIRLDTVGHNEGLINHYTHHGFTFLGAEALSDVAGLPGHYSEDVVLRFEIGLGE